MEKMENAFHETYKRLTPDTKAHADVFNALFDKCLENDKFLKYATDSLAEKMLEKGMIANNLATDNEEMVLSASMGKLLKQQLDEQNNNLNDNIKDILSKIDFIKQNYYCLQGGVEIPQYSDLNEYKQTGSYFCPWNAQTMTLKNIPPIGDAFTLIVYYATGSKEYIGQRLCNYVTGKVYYRVFNIFSNTWTDWALL